MHWITKILSIGCLVLMTLVLLTAYKCNDTQTDATFDLAMSRVCYFVNTDTGEVVVRGVIKNVGQKTVDFGVTHKVPGPFNKDPQGTYAIGANVQGGGHYEIHQTLTDSGLSVNPGEETLTFTSLKLPFHPNNVYSAIGAVVTLNGDSNPANNEHVAFSPGNVTGAQLESMQKNYACPY